MSGIFPVSQAERNLLLQSLKTKLANYQATFGLSDETIRQNQDDAVVYEFLIITANQLENDVAEFFGYKSTVSDGDINLPTPAYPTVSIPALPALAIGVKAGIIPRTKALIRFIKAHPNYTTEIGDDLGINWSGGDPIAPDQLVAGLNPRSMPNDKVEISFSKQGQQAMRIQKRLKGETDFSTVAEPASSPYLDETPSTGGNPEQREYRGILLDKNQAVGQYSPIYTVVTTP